MPVPGAAPILLSLAHGHAHPHLCGFIFPPAAQPQSTCSQPPLGFPYFLLLVESFSWGLRVWSLLCFQVGPGEILSLPAGG